MPLDAQLQPIVDLINSLDSPPPQELSVDEVRSAYAGLAQMFASEATGVTTTDELVPGPAGDIAVRWYRTGGGPAAGAQVDGAQVDGASAGAIVFFHGGGWVIGSIETHDPVCRELAARTGLAVASVEYRLAPEHPYPAAIEDARAATEWIADHAADLGVDPTRLVVAGDSAGGQLAAAVAREWSSQRSPLVLQVLVYPVTDIDVFPVDPDSTSSLVSNGTGYVLTLETMEYFVANYTPDPARRGEPDASPLRAPSLAGVAPALVITAEFDPLRDEGEAYAARLGDAGVPVAATRYDGATHMFVQMLSLDLAQRALDEIAVAVRAATA